MNISYRHLPYGAKTQTPNTIVVHAMGEYIQDVDVLYSAYSWLEKLKLSAHALVHPNGDVTICRSDTEGAYHARGFNTDSLGVEFLVPGSHNYGTFLEALKTDWVTNAQYDSGAELLRNWYDKHTIREVVMHSQISPGRKVDPGAGFKFNFLLSEV